jgi:phosphate uptake regulator
VDQFRRLQKVGYSSLSVSIPKEYARELKLDKGDRVLLRAEADGTLRLIPAPGEKKPSRATIRAEQAGSGEMLVRLIVGAYALGYDSIEVAGREPLDRTTVDLALKTIKQLIGLEVVESDSMKIVGQSFTDPTKFPVDSLIKRLQILVSQSLEDVIGALDQKQTGRLSEVAPVQEEIDKLYWLILRQLLVALSRRELASEIGIESPLHATGDRVSAKALDEIGNVVKGMAEELTRLNERGTRFDPPVAERIKMLAAKATEAFSTTMESLLTPDIKLIEESAALVDETLRLEGEISHEMLERGEYGYARVFVSHFGQLARYCNMIIEIASHRLLRKTSRVAAIQQ